MKMQSSVIRLDTFTQSFQPSLDDGMSMVPNPSGKKFPADFVGPLLLLAAARRNGVDSSGRIANQIRSQGADVVGEVNVF